MDPALVLCSGRRTSMAQMVVMRSQNNVFLFQARMGAGNKPDHVPGFDFWSRRLILRCPYLGLKRLEITAVEGLHTGFLQITPDISDQFFIEPSTRCPTFKFLVCQCFDVLIKFGDGNFLLSCQR